MKKSIMFCRLLFGLLLVTLVLSSTAQGDSRYPENEIDGDIHIKSSAEGSDNYDTTGRLIVESYQKSSATGRFGEGIWLLLKDEDAKNMISWYEDWNGQKRLVGWLGAHSGANNPADPPHNHLSIEVPDASGQMQTRLAIPYGHDRTVIKTSAADFAVQDGKLRIGGAGNREIVFAKETDITRNFEGTRRWAIRVAQEPDNSFRIIRYDANGANPATLLKINSQTGMITAYDDIQFENTLQSKTGPILKDRATGEWRRIYVQNGQLMTEKVTP